MNIFLTILIVLDLIAGSAAGGLAYLGSGVGGGGTGSSISQPVSFSNDDELTASFGIFQKSCDAKNWHGAVAYPANKDAYKNISSYLIKNACKAYDTNNRGSGSGIIFYGGNNLEMSFLKSGNWDRRTLLAVYDLLQLGFTGQKEYSEQMNCENSDGAAAPMMTLGVHFDKNGTAYTKDDGSPNVAATIPTNGQTLTEGDQTQNKIQSISPHAYGQALDVYTFGCFRIEQQDKPTIVVPIDLSMAQSPTAAGVATPAQTIASSQNATGTPIGETPLQTGQMASNEIFASPESVNSYLAQFQNEADLATKSDVQMTADITKKGIAKNLDQNMPADDLAQNGDLTKIGTIEMAKTLNLAAPMINDKTKIQKFWESAKTKLQNVAAHQIGADQNTIEALKAGNYSAAGKLIGANRLNSRLELGLSPSDIQNLAQSGNLSLNAFLTSPKLINLSPISKQAVCALYNSGQTGLENFILSQNDVFKTNPISELVNIMRADNFSNNDYALARDFTSGDSVARSGAIKRAEGGSTKNKKLTEWMKANKNLPPEMIQPSADAVAAYGKSGKGGLDQYPKNFAEQLLSENYQMALSAEQRSALESAYGQALPNGATLLTAVRDKKFQDNLAQVELSSNLQKSGLNSDMAGDLAALAVAKKNNQSVKTVTDAALNKQIGVFNSKFGVSLSKSDFSDPARLQSASVNLAIKQLEQKSGIPLSGKVEIAGFKVTVPSDLGQKLSDALGRPKEDVLAATAREDDADAAIGDGIAAAAMADGLDGNLNVAGADAKAKDGSSVGSVSNTGQTDSALKTKISDYYKDVKAEKKAELAGELISEYGLNQQDAKDLLDGKTAHLKDAIAVSSITKAGILSGDEAHSLVHGTMTLDQKSSISDRIISNKVGLDVSGLSSSLSQGDSSKAIQTAEKMGWDQFEQKTGFSKDQINSITDFAKSPDKITEAGKTYLKGPLNQFQSMVDPKALQAQVQGMSTGIVLNCLVGQQIAQMDPTGGIATSYAMNFLSNQLVAMAVPLWAMAGVALILSPDSFVNIIQGNLQMAMNLIQNPFSFAMGFLDTLTGKKPSVGVPISGSPPASVGYTKSAAGSTANIDSSGKTAADKASEKTTNDANSTSGGKTVDSKANSSLINFTHLIQKLDKPDQEKFKEEAVAVQNLITENLLVFSLAQKGGPYGDINIYYKALMIFDPPSYPMTINQLAGPRSYLSSATDKAGLYKDQVPEKSFARDNYLKLAALIYGAAGSSIYDPTKVSGRVKTIGYLPQADRIHVGF